MPSLRNTSTPLRLPPCTASMCSAFASSSASMPKMRACLAVATCSPTTSTPSPPSACALPSSNSLRCSTRLLTSATPTLRPLSPPSLMSTADFLPAPRSKCRSLPRKSSRCSSTAQVGALIGATSRRPSLARYLRVRSTP
ncbi:secreted protein [gut metagenome]|uniref:Secreted protein n=1 Tax=gut metagenome TaxID=749906 RepID=J9G7Z8_9ZZZZ